MTTLPVEVAYTWEVEVDPGPGFLGWIPVPCTELVPSMDMDRVPFCSVRFTLENITDLMWAALDPRKNPILGNIRFRVACRDTGGVALSWIPREGLETAPSFWAVMHIRTATRDRATGVVTVTATGGESVMDDRKRLSGAAIDTGATTVYGLVEWALLDCFSSISIITDPGSSVAIPAGPRRVMLPADTFNALIEPEMQAIGYRLYDYWGRTWALYEREHTPSWIGAPKSAVLSSYTPFEGAPPHADPIVTGMTETITRDGDYADGVLIKYDTTDSGGSIVWQRSGDGVHTKGLVITYERPAPGGNAAEMIVARTKTRGGDYTITARARFDVLPGMVLYVYTRTGGVKASVRSVEWDVHEGTMTIRAQSGQPIT
jgi:hypothetical protein